MRGREVLMKTLVIGCTGAVGSNLLPELLDKGVDVRCMTRYEEKTRNMAAQVEGVAADLEKPETLSAAFEQVDSVFLLTDLSRNETMQGLNAVAAARAAGVKKIVYLSVYLPHDSTPVPHFNSKIPVEHAIKESGIAFTLLRPNHFFQNDLSVGHTILAYGIYPLPVGLIGMNRIDLRDVADCAVNALTESGHEGLTYNLHGPDSLNGNDMARIYSSYTGRDVRYGGNDLDAWVQRVKNVMPEWLYRDLRVMYKYFQDHGMIAREADLERQRLILRHQPRSFDDFAREIASTWREEPARAA